MGYKLYSFAQSVNVNLVNFQEYVIHHQIKMAVVIVWLVQTAVIFVGLIPRSREEEEFKLINREKVIKGFECCLIYGDGCNKCTNCPYLPEPDCIRQNKRDALALLKEQEAVKPKKADNPDESEYCCGICGYPLWLDEFYCAHCGRRIEWESR